MTRPLTSRQREILTAIVESYIATGEPVSSGTLARSELLAATPISSATIRNEMSELADAGFLDQPHTSAGRIPSAEAFRLYVSQIQSGQMGSGPLHANALSVPSRAELHSRIDTGFAGLAGSTALLERTSHLLASLSSGVGLAIGAAAATDLLEHIHFTRLADRRALAVVVTRSGTVRDRVLALDQDLSTNQLETAARFLNEHFRGWNVERVRSELTRRLDTERSAYRQLSDAIDLWARTMPEAAVAEQRLFIDGVANLVASAAAHLSENRDRLRSLLAALEEKQRLIELLNAYIDSRQESVRVVFDLEEQDPGMAGLVLIAAPARIARDSGDAPDATLAVIAPRRIHYQSTMDAVGYIAQVFDRLAAVRSANTFNPPTP